MFHLALPFFVTAACIACGILGGMTGRALRRTRLDEVFDDGYMTCEAEWRNWQAAEQDRLQSLPPPEPVHAVHAPPVRALPASEATTDTFAIVDAEVVDTIVPGAPAYFGELSDYASAPQPALRAPEDPEHWPDWDDDSIGLLRATGGVREPHQTVSATGPQTLTEVVVLAQALPSEADAVHLPTEGEITTWGTLWKDEITSWRNEDWATTMPWERDEQRVLTPA